LIVDFIGDLKDSIGKFSAYREFSKRTVGRGICYLLLVVLILGSIVLVKTSVSFNSSVNQLGKVFAQQVPEFTLKNGVLDVNATMPIIIKNDGENSIVVIDTTGQSGISALNGYESGVLIEKTRMVQKKNAAQTETIEYSQLQGLTLTKSQLQTWLPKLKLIDIAIYLFGMIYFILSKLATMVILGAIGLMIASLQKVKLEFQQTMTIAAYALTVPLIFQTLDRLFLHDVTTWPVYYLLAAVYLCLAIRSCKEEPKLLDPDVIKPELPIKLDSSTDSASPD
jgi:hypothetical protein